MTTTPTSLLFTPGSMPERFDKACAGDASLICLDLEDAVAPQDKSKARANVIDYLSQTLYPERLCVRVNRFGTIEGLEDTLALARAARLPGHIMLPKVEDARDIHLFASLLPSDVPLIALLESPLGVEQAFTIAGMQAVGFLMFGSFDYAAETGSTQSWLPLLPVRSRLVAAAAAVGKGVIDSPYASLNDVDGAAEESRLARDMGMIGKAAIHPRMIAGIHEAFMPSQEEVEEAQKIVAAFDAADGRVARMDGKLIELPVVMRMRRLLEKAASYS
jgi:citrate lyase subunit beta/citryl-CoA lyase/(S)-citramalyl-CoA lyase